MNEKIKKEDIQPHLLEWNKKPITEQEYRKLYYHHYWDKELIEEWIEDDPLEFSVILTMIRNTEEQKNKVKEILNRVKY